MKEDCHENLACEDDVKLGKATSELLAYEGARGLGAGWGRSCSYGKGKPVRKL